MKMSPGVALVVGALLIAASVSAQTPPQPAGPIFRSGIDLVAVDVSVVDNNGRPVLGLQPQDFVLKVDGAERRIVSADFISTAQPDGKPADAPPPPTYYTSNEHVLPGRLIIIAVDEGNIRRGEARNVLARADRLLDSLEPSDRISVVALPGGVRIDFTGDRQAVRDALGKISGAAERLHINFNIGLVEALAIERGDQRLLQEVIIRECERQGPECGQLLEQEARMIAQTAYAETRQSLAALRGIIDSVRDVEGTKTLVLISEGLVQDASLSEVSAVGVAARIAQVNVYVLLLDVPRFDVSDGRPSPTMTADIQLRSDGLENLAGASRGGLFRVFGNGTAAFDRLKRELSGYYLLSFEPQGSDRNGRPHRIRVEVPRKGTTVRSRHEFVSEPTSTRNTASRARLTRLLRTPLIATELPLRLTTYTFQEGDGAKLRVVVSLEIDPQASKRVSDVTVGFGVIDGKGKVMTSASDRARGAEYSGAIVLDPGRYTLKLAAIDADGRRGSLEHKFTASLIAAGDLQTGDLMLAHPSNRKGLPARPAVDLAPGDRILSYMEVYSATSERLKTAQVQMEVAASEDGEPLVSSPAELSAAGGRRRVAQALMPVRLLPPGAYVMRAILSDSGRTVARLTRPFHINRSGLTLTEDGDAGARLRPELPRFRKEDALTPATVGFFLDELGKFQTAPASSRLSAAMAAAKNGRFQELTGEISSEPGDRLAASFLRGLGLFAKGELVGAMRQFNAALSVSSEFFPAIVYLGACYAAGGHDGEAVGAWQTSLSVETEAPATFFFLADALFRINDGEQAVSVLEEARERWPDDERFVQRLATAYTMVGKQSDAITLLEPYIDKHPEDLDALFLVMRLLYEAHAQGRTLSDDDRGKLRNYAAAYASAKGPQQAIVEQWVKFVDKK